MTLGGGKAKDKFPAFDLSEFLSVGGESDDDASINSSASKYQTKEDQDVAVFMAIAERMSISQLTHLLQGKSRLELNLPPLPTRRTKKTPSDTTSPTNKATGSKDGAPATVPFKRIKKFRFAEIAGGKQVRTVVHEIQSIKRMPWLWWSDDEMLQIRKQAIDTVKHFRKHRPTFAGAVESVATKSTVNDPAVQDAMKQLTRDSFARGLETHIVSFLAQARRECVQAVLDEQRECRLCNDSYELAGESLRGQSQAYSQTSRTFAARMAGCDQIEALKATLSVWEAGQEDTEHPVDESLSHDEEAAKTATNNNNNNNNSAAATVEAK